MKHGVAIYGGFPDFANNALMHDRNWRAHVTTLQGNGNSVVKNENNNLTSGDILDGFTITGGNAYWGGGGIYNHNTSPSYTNLHITSNKAVNEAYAAAGGGGMLIAGSNSPTVTNVVVSLNLADVGGGIYIHQSSPKFTNALICRNEGSMGAGISSSLSHPLLINVTLTNNDGAEWFDQYSTSSPIVRNSIIYGYVSGGLNDIQNSLVYYGTGDAYTDIANNNLPPLTNPQFLNPNGSDYDLMHNYSLVSTSPAINKGSNAFFTGLGANTPDLAGNPRLAGKSIDMGAFELRAVLTWKTEETNVSHYEVERSDNAKDFRVTVTVKADGNGTANYSLADPVSVFGGVIYYRIRQVDLDGTSSYSRIISIDQADQQVVVGSFYPNPSNEKVMVDVNTPEEGRWTLTVTDARGQNVSTKMYNLQKGKNTISLEHFTQGINLIRFDYGQFSATRKLVRK
jgi:hypothetical protein